LIGCPQLATSFPDDKDKTPAETEDVPVSGGFSQAPQLTFTTGDYEGEIKYSWTAAVPVAGAYYYFYIAPGAKNETADVIDNGTLVKYTGGAYSGIFTGTPGAEYSALVRAARGSGSAYSAVVQAQASSAGPRPNEAVEFRFGVISDTHIGSAGRGAPAYSNENRLAKVLDWYNTQPNIKAMAIVGDITDHGYQAEWNTFTSTWDAHKGSMKLIAVMGNHDAYPSDKGAAADYFEAATGEKTNAHYVIEGYHFIVLNAGSGAMTSQGAIGDAVATGRTATPGKSENSGDVVPQSVRDWARTRIDAAKAAAPGQPIFVFLHWPVQNTFYVSDEWYASSFGGDPMNGFFKNDPEVVIFGGHIHSPNSDPRSIWQGGFTSVNTVTLHYMEMESTIAQGSGARQFLGDSPDGVELRTYPKHPVLREYPATTTNPSGEGYTSGPAAQGMIVTVKGSEVKIENYDFGVSRGNPADPVEQLTPQTWEFDVSAPGSFPYTPAVRNGQKTAPEFTGSGSGPVSGKASAADITDTSVTLTFDQAYIPGPNPGKEEVHHYKIEFYKSGSLVKTVRQWSDFMNTPSLRKSTYTQLIGGLSAGSSYDVRIYAISSFQQESSQYLTASFTTTGSAVTPLEFDLKFQDNLNNDLSNPAAVTVTGTTVYDTGRAVSQRAIKLKGDNYIQLDTPTEPFDYNQSFSVAFWIKVLTTKGSDPVFFSNKNWASGGNNGFLFMVKSSGIRLNSKSVSDSGRLNGSNDITIVSGVMDTWVHIAVVYDKTAGTNGQVRYYANGVKVGQTDTNLTSGMAGGQRSYLAQSNTSSNGPLYNGAAKSYDVEVLMQDFLLKGGVLSDGEIAALAAP
jgi:predicted phosphodiesterase